MDKRAELRKKALKDLQHSEVLMVDGHFDYDPAGGFTLRAFYRAELKGKRVLLADDVRNTGETFARCAALVKEAGGTLLATAEIYDRCEPAVDPGVPNIALAEYRAPENY